MVSQDLGCIPRHKNFIFEMLIKKIIEKDFVPGFSSLSSSAH